MGAEPKPASQAKTQLARARPARMLIRRCAFVANRHGSMIRPPKAPHEPDYTSTRQHSFFGLRMGYATAGSYGIIHFFQGVASIQRAAAWNLLCLSETYVRYPTKGRECAGMLLPDLILRSAPLRASRRMNVTSRATWFETALTRLLTMRV